MGLRFTLSWGKMGGEIGYQPKEVTPELRLVGHLTACGKKLEKQHSVSDTPVSKCIRKNGNPCFDCTLQKNFFKSVVIYYKFTDMHRGWNTFYIFCIYIMRLVES